MTGKLYTSGDFRRLEEALAGELSRCRSADPTAEAIVVAGSNPLCSYLNRKMAVILGGVFNVRFVTLPGLVRLVEERSQEPPRDRLNFLASRVLVDEIAAAGVPACFSEAAQAGGFAPALQSTFTDLAEGGCGAAEARALIGSGDPVLGSPRLAGVLEMYARYRERVESLGGDIHSRFAGAAAGAAGATEGVAVFAYGFYDLNELQYRLLSAAMSGGAAAHFIPWSEERPYGFARPLIDRLVGEGFVHEHLGGGAAPEVTELFSAPDPVEEAREVVRRIIEIREDGGTGFVDTAILPWSREDWSCIAEALDEAGVPWSSDMDSPPPAGTVRGAALRLLDVLCGDGGRSDIVDFLISSPIATGGDAAPGVDPFALWVRLSAEEGLRGDAGWEEENRRLIEKLDRRDEMEGPAEGPRRSELIAPAVEAVSVMERARKTFAACGDWSGFSAAFADALRGLFDGEDARGVIEAVETLADLDGISSSCDPARFRRIAAIALEEGGGRGRGEPGGDGVSVILAGRARGLVFDVAFMTGLREGAVPGGVRQDPFIRDREREAIAGATGGAVRLSLKGGRIDESTMIFRMACSSASGRLVCSWPRLEPGGGKEFTPTSCLRFVPGLPAGSSARAPAAVRVPLRGRPEGGEVPLGEDDYDFLMTGRRIGRVIHYPSSVFFARGAAMIKARWGTRRFTPYDGVFESPRAIAQVDEAMEEKGWNLSATTLQAWAECPFAFLVEKLIGIESVEEPERELTIDPLQRGTLTHLVLEKLYTELSRDGLFPLSAATLSGAMETAERVTREVLDFYESTEPVGHPLFWEYERETIAASVSGTGTRCSLPPGAYFASKS